MNKVSGTFFCIFLLALNLPAHRAMAADSDAADIEKLDQAWQEVRKEADAMVARTLATVADGDATERYNAYTNAIAMTMDLYTDILYRSSSRDQPEYLPYSTPITNSCAPNMMTRYGVAYIEPGASYRVWGTRGNAMEIDIQQWLSYNDGGSGEGYPIAAAGEFAQKTFSAQGIKIDKQGRFEFIISPTRPAKGQWWKLLDGTRVLMFRDAYADYSEEAIPPEFHLEKIGPRDRGPTTLSAAEALHRLRYFGRALKNWDICFKVGAGIPLHGFIKKNFTSDPDDKTSGSGQQVNQTYYLSEYHIEPGQALIIEWKPPATSLYWNIQLHTRVGQYFNFGARQVDLTSRMAHVDKDGRIRFVLSHGDPHVANWLDPDGNKRGQIWLRCKICSANDLPTVKLVRTDEIMNNLPQDTLMVSDAERLRQLDLRRRHYVTRYRQ